MTMLRDFPVLMPIFRPFAAFSQLVVTPSRLIVSISVIKLSEAL